MPINTYSLLSSISLALWFYAYLQSGHEPVSQAITETVFIAGIIACLYISYRIIREINTILM
ncbi:MAG TPA: hypothetical protein VK436_04040 [Methanocella sp.]|nr:hypothetical protein [Methanocella sp.]